ncbi:MAG TPA: bifunctional diaminohydroxyphosphoribosylaminopyrimidine deaminase/5-amino-6-(5-phosphoribosylamino)uracil reductase RibD [Verrucomicrobiae bacterium]|nr:bifunctional diaminohydroxyphosphoribosylaminopyrimidine deaminase/5-amino-6-(5-phosphoribosylamino)uracil reductase RibD [Verrucomicrobiae bacterium]
MNSVDEHFMRLALRLARQGYGTTSPNPTVGAVLVKQGSIIGQGRTAPVGGPHAEIRALQNARRRGLDARGATLYVTLEPCCTHGRTPPCTDAIVAAGVRRVVVGTTDPNPKHSGKGFTILKRSGIEVFANVLSEDCSKLNEAFNHWIVHRTPFVTVKAAMTLDGKIATASGESKWITGEKARAYGMKLRQGSDAILVGVNTVLADDPSLTVRTRMQNGEWKMAKPIRRIVLDSLARTPLGAKVITDEHAAGTTIVVGEHAPPPRVHALAKRVNVLILGGRKSHKQASERAIDLRHLLRTLGAEDVTSLLVEGGGEVNASFLLGRFAQRVAFFYAPKILGGREGRKAVGGEGVVRLADALELRKVEWRRLGEDLLLTARVPSRDD